MTKQRTFRHLYLMLIAIILFTNYGCKQIPANADDLQKVTYIPYDSSYFQLPPIASKAIYKGLVGQHLHSEDGSSWVIQDIIDGRKISFKLVEINSENQKMINQSEFSRWYLESGFNKLKKFYLNRSVFPIINERSKLVSFIENQDLVVNPKDSFTITNLKYVKFQDEFAIALEIDESQLFKVSPDDLEDQNSRIIVYGNTDKNSMYLHLNNLDGMSIPYDDSGEGIFNRKIIKRNWKALVKGNRNSSKKGKIVVKIFVNRNGDVIDGEILPKETTITDPKMLDRAIEAAKGYKLEENLNAAEVESGKLIFNININ